MAGPPLAALDRVVVGLRLTTSVVASRFIPSLLRQAEHNELQLLVASELGLRVPRSLYSNDPVAVRRFFRDLEGRVVTKIQNSFAVYRGDEELVVFTTQMRRKDLAALDGLRYSPMLFQERLEKKLELRATVVSRRIFSASIDAQQRQATTAVDCRRDGMGLVDAWEPYQLPRPVERALVELVARFGLAYAAAAFVLTPRGHHVFLEINTGGEWYWLARNPGLPTAEALADLLLSRERRRPARRASKARSTGRRGR